MTNWQTFYKNIIILIFSIIVFINRNKYKRAAKSFIEWIILSLICLVFVLAGFPMVMDVFPGWVPQALINAISGMSFLAHFEAITRGVIDLRDLIFFLSFIGCWLLANAIVVEMAKSE